MTASKVEPERASSDDAACVAPLSAAEPAQARSGPPEAGDLGASDAPVVQLPSFEGPLDLLLHLIQQHELDILDIPIRFITEKYLSYIKLMRNLSIDVASEYLVMAATLAHIKSKMLLPAVPSGQEDDGLLGADELDPRQELVRRLLEYQKYKNVAAELGSRDTLGRDVFVRGTPEAVPEGPAPFAPMGVFTLLDAFDRVLKRANVRIDHEVTFDRISITDRIVQLSDVLQARRAVAFEDLFERRNADGTAMPVARFELVITFLAILEMCKLKLIRVYQSDPLAPIHVELSVTDDGGTSVDLQPSGPAPAAPQAPSDAVLATAPLPSDEVIDGD